MTDSGDFSVLMSVYAGCDLDQLTEALDSITDQQTLKPDEIVLVVDGPIPDPLDELIQRFADQSTVRVKQLRLPENVGLGAALNQGLHECSHEIVARMDTDDISVAERFEKQYNHMIEHPEIDVLSAWYGLFEDDPSQVTEHVEMPVGHNAIIAMGKFRSPVCHAACFFRKQAVVNAGNYSSDFRKMQDYHLWVRLIAQQAVFDCLPEVLYYLRSNGFAQRRVGMGRFLGQVKIHTLMFRLGNISLIEFVRNILVRLICLFVPYSAVLFYTTGRYRSFAPRKR